MIQSREEAETILKRLIAVTRQTWTYIDTNANILQEIDVIEQDTKFGLEPLEEQQRLMDRRPFFEFLKDSLEPIAELRSSLVSSVLTMSDEHIIYSLVDAIANNKQINRDDKYPPETENSPSLDFPENAINSESLDGSTGNDSNHSNPKSSNTDPQLSQNTDQGTEGELPSENHAHESASYQRKSSGASSNQKRNHRIKSNIRKNSGSFASENHSVHSESNSSRNSIDRHHMNVLGGNSRTDTTENAQNTQRQNYKSNNNSYSRKGHQNNRTRRDTNGDFSSNPHNTQNGYHRRTNRNNWAENQPNTQIPQTITNDNSASYNNRGHRKTKKDFQSDSPRNDLDYTQINNRSQNHRSNRRNVSQEQRDYKNQFGAPNTDHETLENEHKADISRSCSLSQKSEGGWSGDDCADLPEEGASKCFRNEAKIDNKCLSQRDSRVPYAWQNNVNRTDKEWDPQPRKN